MSRTQKILFVLVLIGVGIVCRLVPHLWNTTPLTAIVLFATAYFGYRYALASMLVILLVSDAFIGFYQWEIMAFVYAGLVLSAVVGLVLRKNRTTGRVLLGALASSILFFIVTNWAVWQFGTMYTHTLSGLLQSYSMALPFFKNSLLGDVCYTGILFGAYEMFRAMAGSRRVSREVIVTSQVR